MWKVEKVPNELSDLAKEILSKVLKVLLGSFLLLVVRFKRTEIN